MRIILLLLAATGLGYAFYPRTAHLREFDPARVAHLETAMWRDYYERDDAGLFGGLYAVNLGVYGFSPWDSARLAWQAATAARVFQPTRSRAEARAAERPLETYFAIIRARSDEQFDPADLARRELDWWQLRREEASPERYGALVADVSAGMFGNDNADVRRAGLLRARMMRYRDERRNGLMGEADWTYIEDGLVESYRLLKAGIGGGPGAPGASTSSDAPPPYRAPGGAGDQPDVLARRPVLLLLELPAREGAGAGRAAEHGAQRARRHLPDGLSGTPGTGGRLGSIGADHGG
jgi:hypothetical protein